MKKVIRRLKLVHIDVLIYRMEHYMEYNLSEFKYTIEKTRVKNKCRYFIKDFDILVHESYLYDSVFLLKSLNKKGPVIGDCFTNKRYRGQAIYPLVINTIAKEALENDIKEVFVVVTKNNISSIKGIEKAGFSKFATINATRWLWFYLKRKITF